MANGCTGDGMEGERTVRRRIRIVGEKVCEVCGDKALAHHFGVLACETCKAFFRRNASKEIKPCSYESKCDINKTTRKNCSACRLKKCFDAGMKPELIFDDDQKRQLNEKMQQTRLKRQSVRTDGTCKSKVDPVTKISPSANGSSIPSAVGDSSINSTLTCSIPMAKSVSGSVAFENGVSMNIDKRSVSDMDDVKKVFPASVSDNSPAESCLTGTDQPVTGESERGKFTSGNREHVQASFPQATANELGIEAAASGNPGRTVPQVWAPKIDLALLSRDQLPSDPQMYWRLSEEERMILTLLSSVYENTVLGSLKERQGFPHFDMSKYSISDFLEDCDVQCRLAVNFVKQLEDFRRLTLDDQIACFKGSVGPVMTIRNAFIFVVERKSWIMIKGEMTEEHVMKLFPENRFYDWSLDCHYRLKTVAKNDITLYALLHCILLFDPSMDKITDRQTVSIMCDKYVILLRHYLESVFSYAYADEYLRFFQDILMQACQLNKATKTAAKECSENGKECCQTEEYLRYEFLVEIATDS